jgi:hypothetical protein
MKNPQLETFLERVNLVDIRATCGNTEYKIRVILFLGLQKLFLDLNWRNNVYVTKGGAFRDISAI